MATKSLSKVGGTAGLLGSSLAWRIGLLVSTAVLAIAKACSMPRIPQDSSYFDFVGDGARLGIPHAPNVLSNVAFAAVGVAGLLSLWRGRITFRDARERWPWYVFFAGVALTSVGSAWFHLAPDVDSLVWDRVPMAMGFMGLFAALWTERIDVRVGLRLLPPLVALGVGTVVYWIQTEHAGVGDLRPYLLVQLYPLVAIPLVLVLFPPRYTATWGWLGGLALYAAAKWAEVLDGRVYAALRIVSGHTVKHLLAACGISVLLLMLRVRHARGPASDGAGQPGSLP